MSRRDVTTSDGVRLRVDVDGEGRPLVLLHGWPFSGRFFLRNVPALGEAAQVVTLDLRGHGDSDRPPSGYRLARLAHDLHDVLVALDLRETTVLGWSIGSAVVWSYLELFGTDRLAGAVFVSQSPRQYYAPDWKLGHREVYDQAQLTAQAARVEADLAAFDEQQLGTVFASDPTDEERALFLAEMGKSPAASRNALMADHTSQDWRDLLPTLDLPCLVLAAAQDQAFPLEAVAWVGDHVPGARTVVFEHSGHALFFDEPERFAQVVLEFVGR